MNTSEQINELAGALAKAQAEMKNATLNKVNPHFKSKYADLAAIRDAIVPVLAKHGLSIVQGTTAAPTLTTPGSYLVVTTRLMHSSGQWLQSDYPITNDTSKPQAMGSALTYARRYSLAAMGVIAAEEDDDGNAAQKDLAGPHSADKTVSRSPEGDTAHLNGTPGASKAQSRKVYEVLVATMRTTQSRAAQKEWLKLNQAQVDALPSDWMSHFDDAYQAHREELEARAPA